jgi:ABC-type molybdate transport system substrate-binding protein
MTGVNNRNAEAFYTYLQSNEAKKVLGKYGFAIR